MKDNREAKKHNFLVNEMSATYHTISQNMNLSDSASMILYTLCSEDGSLEISKITKYTGLSKQTVSSSLRSLENKGYIYLAPINKKSKMVCLTKEGEIFCENTVCKMLDAENSILLSWSEHDRNLYFSLMEDFLNKLRKETIKNEKHDSKGTD